MKIGDIFRDDNQINEKNVVGALSFIIMSLIALVNVIMGILNEPFEINEYIYNSFVIITVGAFGISEFRKIFNKKN